MIDGFEGAILDLRPDLAKSLFESYESLFGRNQAQKDLIPDSLLQQLYRRRNEIQSPDEAYTNTVDYLLSEVQISTERLSHIIEASYNMVDYEGFGEFIVSLGSKEILDNAKVQEQLQINALRAQLFKGHYELFAPFYNAADDKDKQALLTPQVIEAVKAYQHWDALIQLIPTLKANPMGAKKSTIAQEQDADLCSKDKTHKNGQASRASEFDANLDAEDLKIMMPLYTASMERHNLSDSGGGQQLKAVDSAKAKTSNKV